MGARIVAPVSPAGGSSAGDLDFEKFGRLRWRGVSGQRPPRFEKVRFGLNRAIEAQKVGFAECPAHAPEVLESESLEVEPEELEVVVLQILGSRLDQAAGKGALIEYEIVHLLWHLRHFGSPGLDPRHDPHG